MLIVCSNANAHFAADTTEKKDSLPKYLTDTIGLNKPLENHGKVSLLGITNVNSITKQDIQFINYSTYFDVFKEKLNAYPLSLGNFGEFNSFSFFGGKPSDISMTFNNREMIDLEYMNFNLEEIPPEFIESAEVFTGSDAAVLFSSSSTVGINFQEIKYNTRTPFTRLWYSQAGSDFIAADGIFSQNFLKNVNFTFGFRTLNTAGRETNTMLETWNLRGILRWNLAPLVNISLTENFNNYGTGLNGGMNPDLYPNVFDNLAAIPNYNLLSQRVFRHDVNLSLSYIFTNDSSAAFTSSLFYVHAEHNTSEDQFLNLIPGDSSNFYKYFERQFGITGKLETKPLNFFSLIAGASAEYRKLDSNQYEKGLDYFYGAAYGYGKININNKFNLSGGIRTEKNKDDIALSFGAKLETKFSDKSDFYVDLSRIQRSPSPIDEQTASKEISYLGLSSLKLKINEFNFEISAFARKTDNPILYKAVTDTNKNIISTTAYNEKTLNSYGGSVLLETIPFKNVHCSLKLLIQKSFLNGNVFTDMPIYYGTIKAYYEIHAGSSILNLGFQSGLISSFTGEQFVPQTRAYIPVNEQIGLANTGIDLFATARLGDAYVRVTMQNALSENYYFVPYYPEYTRIFRITFTWSFFN